MAGNTIATLVVELQGNVTRLQRDMQQASRTVTKEVRTMRESAESLGTAFRGVFAGAAVVAFGRSLFDAATKMEQFRVAFAAAAGSAEEGARNLRFVRDMSEDMGVSFVDSARAFQRFSAAVEGTSLEGDKAQKIFTSFAGAARVLGASAEDTGRIFMALEQMVSKGSVQTEELRGQLGEHLPGAFRLAAQAMGVTTAELNKMLKAGEVTAEELLPKLAEKVDEVYGKAVPEASKLAIAELQRLRNEWLKTQAAFANNSGSMTIASTAFKGLTDVLRTLGTALDDNRSKAERLNAALQFAPLGLGNLARPFIPNTPLLQDQSVIDSENARLLGRAPAPGPATTDPFFGDPSVRMFEPSAKDIAKFDKAQAKQRDAAAKEAAKRRQEIAKLQVETTEAYAKALRNVNLGEEENLSTVIKSVDSTERLEKLREQQVETAVAYAKALQAMREGTLGEEENLSTVIATGKATVEMTDAARELGFTFQSAFEDAILAGEDLSDVLQALDKDIARIIIRQTITKPAADAVTKAVGSIDFSKIFGGAKASGGPVSGGTPYLVGEEGPELFVPGRSGTIVPNGAMGGASIHFAPVVHIDSRTDRAEVAALVDRAMRSSESRLIRSARNGGPLARALNQA